MSFLIFGIDINLLILVSLQLSHVESPEAPGFQLLLHVEIIALHILLQSDKEIDKILHVLQPDPFHEFQLSDPPLSHLL